MLTKILIITGTLLVFGLLAFMMNRSINRHNSRPKGKVKKGRMKYMQESKRPGK